MVFLRADFFARPADRAVLYSKVDAGNDDNKNGDDSEL